MYTNKGHKRMFFGSLAFFVIPVFAVYFTHKEWGVIALLTMLLWFVDIGVIISGFRKMWSIRNSLSEAAIFHETPTWKRRQKIKNEREYGRKAFNKRREVAYDKSQAAGELFDLTEGHDYNLYN